MCESLLQNSSGKAPRRKSLKSVRVSSFQDTQETEHVNRVFNWIVSVAEGNEGRAKINIKELGASWKLFALRAFHVWTFFLAIVVIGDFFTGTSHVTGDLPEMRVTKTSPA